MRTQSETCGKSQSAVSNSANDSYRYTEHSQWSLSGRDATIFPDSQSPRTAMCTLQCVSNVMMHDAESEIGAPVRPVPCECCSLLSCCAHLIRVLSCRVCRPLPLEPEAAKGVAASSALQLQHMVAQDEGRTPHEVKLPSAPGKRDASTFPVQRKIDASRPRCCPMPACIGKTCA